MLPLEGEVFRPAFEIAAGEGKKKRRRSSPGPAAQVVVVLVTLVVMGAIVINSRVAVFVPCSVALGQSPSEGCSLAPPPLPGIGREICGPKKGKLQGTGIRSSPRFPEKSHKNENGPSKEEALAALRKLAAMGGRVSSSAAAARQGASSQAAKRRLPEFDQGAEASASAGVAPATGTESAGDSASRYAGLERYNPDVTSASKDESLDEMLRQLSGMVKTKSTPVEMDPRAVAHARRLRKEEQREANANRISVRDVERLLGDPKAVGRDKGVPREIVEGLLDSIRMPREEDYVPDDRDTPPRNT